MRVVIDTNIFISALLGSSGPPGLIYSAWRRNRFQLVTTQTQLAELKRASRYVRIASRISPHVLGKVLNIMGRSEYDGAIPRKNECNDPDDAYLLDLAEASGADYLITGDRRSGLLEKGSVGRASILTAKSFVERLSL